MVKRIAPGLLLSALALLCWCAALFCVQGMDAFTGGVAVRWSGEGGISPASLGRYERWAAEDGDENFPQVTLWLEGRSVAADADSGREHAATVLTLFGDGAQAWPASFQSGGYPVRGDGAGCAVDRSVAEALWGSARAVGNELLLDGKTYVVRGVFAGGDGRVLTQAEEGSAANLDRGVLRFPAGTTLDGAERWLAAHDAGGGALLDLPLLGWLWSLLALLPGGVLALGILARLLRRGWTLRSAPLLLGAYLIPALAAGTAALWCAGGAGAFPVRLLPDKWSDFGFWPRAFAALAGEVRDALSAPGVRDFAYWPLALGGLLLAMAAVLFTVLAAERVRVRSEGGAVLGCCGAILGAYACALLFAPAGGLALPRGVWLLPGAWLWTDWALWRHGIYLKGGEHEKTLP